MGRPNLTQHRKFSRLTRSLGSLIRARGALELMWETGYQNGDDYLGDSADVEAAAQWDGEPGKLATALLTAGGEGHAGFIDETPDRPGHYRIHDLWQHAPEYVRKRARREEERKQKSNPVPFVPNNSAATIEVAAPATGQCPPIGGQSPATGRQRTPSYDWQDGVAFPPTPAPSPTPVNKNIPQLKSVGVVVQRLSEPSEAQIEAIYKQYPRKRGKVAAKKAIRRGLTLVVAGDADHAPMALGEAVEYLVDRLTLYARSVKGCDSQFIPYPATWFNAGSFWDDEQDWDASRKTKTSLNPSEAPLPTGYISEGERLKRDRQQKQNQKGEQ